MHMDGRVKLNTGENGFFSVREDNLHRHGVALTVRKKA